MKNNTIKKFIWFNGNDSERFLSYLKDMAKEGYIFSGFSKFRILFEVGSPKVLDFACDYCNSNDLESSVKADVHSGWQHIGARKKMHYYKRDSIDEKSDAYPVGMSFHNVSKLAKTTSITHLMLLLVCLFNIGLILTLKNIDITYRYLNGVTTTQGFIVFFNLSLLYFGLDNVINIRKINNKDKKGLLLSNKIPYKNKLMFSKIAGTVMILIASLYLLISMTLLYSATKARANITYPLDNIGVMSMADFSREGFQIDSSYAEVGNLDFHNFIEKNKSILVPIQIELHQQIKYPGEVWPDNSGEYSPSLRSIKYECLTETIAIKLSRDLVEDSHYGLFKKTNNSETDDLWTLTESRSYHIVARQGKIIYIVHYYGEEAFDEILETLLN